MGLVKRESAWTVYGSCALILFGCLLFSFSSLDFSEAAMRSRVRIASRTAFFFFILPFWAGPLWKVWKHDFSKFLMQNRRYLGIAAAFSQTVFIGLVAWTYSNIPRPLDEILALREMIIGYSGMVTYWVLAFTSNDTSAKFLGKNWKILHMVGLYYLWYIYINSYAPGLHRVPEHILPLAFLVGGFALRMYLAFSHINNKEPFKQKAILTSVSAVVLVWMSTVIYTGQSI